MNIPRASRKVPPDYNPIRRLFAAVTVTAIRDAVTENAPHHAKSSAIQFLMENSDVIAEIANVPETTVIKTLELE